MNTLYGMDRKEVERSYAFSALLYGIHNKQQLAVYNAGAATEWPDGWWDTTTRKAAVDLVAKVCAGEGLPRIKVVTDPSQGDGAAFQSKDCTMQLGPEAALFVVLHELGHYVDFAHVMNDHGLSVEAIVAAGGPVGYERRCPTNQLDAMRKLRIDWVGKNGPDNGHGPQYCRVLLDLVGKYIGEEFQTNLAKEMDHYGAKVAA